MPSPSSPPLCIFVSAPGSVSRLAAASLKGVWCLAAAVCCRFRLWNQVVVISASVEFDPGTFRYQSIKKAICQVFEEASASGMVIVAAAGNYNKTIEGFFPACESRWRQPLLGLMS